MITYRLEDLTEATAALQKATSLLANNNNPKAANLIKQGWALIDETPVSDELSLTDDFTAVFKTKRKKRTDKVYGRQAQVEEKWDRVVKDNYQKAKTLANLAIDLVK